MNYFEEQQKEWWEGGIFVYAEDKGVVVKVDDIPDDPNPKELEKVQRRIYKKLGLNWRLGEIPSDYDPYNQCVRV